MTDTSSTRIWPILSYRDARAGMAFLTDAFGFEARAAYAREDDPAIVEHAEMAWPGGGGIMLGTAGKDDTPFGVRASGNDAVYLVCEDPDALFARATAAGAEVVRGLVDEDFGSRGFTVRDPEGNLWSFGTYGGEGAATPDRETFTALYDEWDKALVANDAAAIGAFATPDWVFVGETGIMPGERFLAAVAAGTVSHDSMTSEVHDVRVFGDVAVVFSRVRNSGRYEGHAFTLDEWSTDTFVRRDGGWRCSITHLTSVAGPR
jgi:uncharacterized glyoxalase superfamily protein PhnB/ketosteroid isomerase-like protein